MIKKTKAVKASRREAAEQRNSAYAEKSIEQKILDAGPKERAKLISRQENNK